MKLTDAAEDLETNPDPSEESRELALDAIAFVQALHTMFKDNGMTSTEEPNVDELENLIDALYGELGAATIFLCEPSFARVPDMLRAVSKKLDSMPGSAPPVIIKGYSRLAKRIENTRQASLQLINLGKDQEKT